MAVLETERLVLRKLESGDAPFILELLNEPSFHRYIGDKGVRTLDDAREYITTGPVESYARFGFGLFLTALKDGDIPIGICGLLKRDSLDHVDIGFAFLPAFWGSGYAHESAAAVMAFGKSAFGLERIVAIVAPDNHASLRLLGKLGMRFDRMIRMSEEGAEIQLLVGDL